MTHSERSGTTSKSIGRPKQLSLLFKPASHEPARPHPKVSLPITWVPRAYQREDMKWLLSHPEAALLLDLGLGKTTVALGAFCALRAAGGARKALVVAPRRPAQLVWTHVGEVGKWAQFCGLRVSLLHGPRKDDALEADADLYVINFEGLPWLAKRDGFRRLLARGVDVIIIDELSKLRNARTQRHKLLSPWLGRFRRRWGLTGSPCPRSLLDLHGEMKAVDLGRRLGRFITHYRQEFFYPTGFGGFEWRPKPGAERAIMARLRDVVVARKASDHLDLPDLVEQNVWVDLPPDARRAYDDMEDELVAQIDGGTVTAKNSAVAAGKCCQIASGGLYRYANDGGGPIDVRAMMRAADPAAFFAASGRRETLLVHDEKTEALEELLDELQGAPTFVLYDYQHDLERIQARLKGVPVIGGGTSDRVAADLVARWNRGELPVLLGHPASMGHGLNMQGSGCGHIVFYTVPWDLELYDQAIGRFRRQGTTASRVVVHRLLARDTVDEAKVKSLASKDRTQRSMFDALRSSCTERRNTRMLLKATNQEDRSEG